LSHFEGTCGSYNQYRVTVFNKTKVTYDLLDHWTLFGNDLLLMVFHWQKIAYQ